MSRQYPIWLDINSCAYSGAKSYGIKKHGKQTIYVGSGAKNSHKFADISMTCNERHDEKQSYNDAQPRYREFTLTVDGKVIKRMTYDMKKKEMCDNLGYWGY